MHYEKQIKRRLKKIPLTLLMCIILNLLNAQIIHIGAIAGVNEVHISDLLAPAQGESNPKSNLYFGFHAGGVVNIKVFERWSVESSFLYYTCGGKQTLTVAAASKIDSGDDPGDPVNTISTTAYNKTKTINTSYFQIPLLIRYKLKLGLNFFAGPYWGFLLSAKEKDITGTYTLTNVRTLTGFPTLYASSVIPENSTSVNLDSGNVLNTLDIGLRIGAGYDLQSGLGFNIGYDLGLTPIFISQTYAPQNQTSPPVTVPAWGKNGVVTLSIKYMLPIFK